MSESWWIGKSRDEFHRIAHDEARLNRLRQTREYLMVGWGDDGVAGGLLPGRVQEARERGNRRSQGKKRHPRVSVLDLQ